MNWFSKTQPPGLPNENFWEFIPWTFWRSVLVLVLVTRCCPRMPRRCAPHCPFLSPTTGTAGRAIGDARLGRGGWARTRAAVGFSETHSLRARIYLRGSSPPVLTPCVLCTEQCCCSSARGRLGGAVAVGMGNMLGPGEIGRRCMLLYRGGAIRGLAEVQCGKRRGPKCGERAPAMHLHNREQYFEEEAGYCQADCSIMPGTRKLHGPAPHWALALRSAM